MIIWIIKTRSGGSFGHGWEEFGEGNFGLGSLKSMNRDMEEKGIALRELSCRTYRRDLPPPDLPVSAAVQLPGHTRLSSRKASAAVHLPEYTAGAAGLPPAAGRLQADHTRDVNRWPFDGGLTVSTLTDQNCRLLVKKKRKKMITCGDLLEFGGHRVSSTLFHFSSSPNYSRMWAAENMISKLLWTVD